VDELEEEQDGMPDDDTVKVNWLGQPGEGRGIGSSMTDRPPLP